MSGPQFEYWKHTHLTVDVVPGRGSGFSLEAPEGVRFLIRSRLFTDEAEQRCARPRGTRHGARPRRGSSRRPAAAGAARRQPGDGGGRIGRLKW